MWTELLPAMAGGTLIDHDAPDEPTEIVEAKLEGEPPSERIMIVGKDFSWMSLRQYAGVRVENGELEIATTFGQSCTVKLPARTEAKR